MPYTLSDGARALLEAKNFAVIATTSPDGSPQTSVVWYEFDGAGLQFSAQAQRRKVRNLARDPRTSVTVYDLANPYHSVELRGTASISPDPTGALSMRLSHRYVGEDPQPDPPGTERVIVRITPEKAVEFPPPAVS